MNDLIKRQDALDALDAEPEVWIDDDEYTKGMNAQWKYDRKAIEALPSAEVTVEELKQIANELGYNIIKKQDYIKLLPCKCGCNRREHWYGTDKDNAYILKCSSCGAKAQGSTVREAHLNWNRMVSE